MLAPLENRALLEREPDDAANERIAELGRQLMKLKDANEHPIVAAQRVWHLDKTICAAHRECERLARERDNLALRLTCQAAELIN